MGVDTPAAEVIRDGLRPVIGVLTSYDVDQLCAKNNLSFCDLLLPFSSLANEVALKDPTNQAVTHSARNLSIDFRDLRKDGFLLAFTVMPHVLSEAVRSTPEDSAASSTTALLGECTWYKSFRDGFLYWAEPAEHEFLRHYLACLLVVSTSHPDPLEQLTKLSQAQHNQQHGGMGQTSGAPAETVAGPAHAATPKWFLPNIFKYHVLVHDVSTGDDRRAEELYQTMKMAYGANACHLLRINSTQPTEATVADMPDPWRQCLERKYRGLHQGLRVARMHALAKAMAASAVDHSAIDASQIPSMNVSSVSADLNNDRPKLSETPRMQWLQAGFLRDYLTVVRDTKAPSSDLPEFPVPRIVTESLKVFYGGHPPASAQVIEDEHRDLFDQTDPEHLWTELEKASWLACSPNTAKLRVATLFKPVVDEGRTPDEHRRPTPANERFTVQTNIVNFLQVPIALCDVSVEYEPMESGKVTVETLDCLVLGAGEEKQLRLWLVPDSEVTSLSVTAIKLSLSPVGADNVPDKSLAVQGRLPLRLRGRRLNSNTQQRTAVVHAPDHRLQPTVTSQPWPLLSVELTARDGSPIDHLTCHCGEIRSFSLRLTNIAAVGVRSVCVVADPLDAVALTRRSATSGADNEELMETKVIDGHTVWTFPHDWNLAPAASSECTLWLRAPQKAGKSAVQLVVYYETESGSQLSPAITPWPHQGGRGTHLALLWKAHVVDRNGKSGFIFGEQWCPVTIPRTSGYEPALAVVQSPPATTEGAPALSFSLPSIDASLSESQSTVASVTCSAVVDRVLIAHDFHAERLCNVPVGLKLTNTSRTAPARVVLRCSNANIAELTAASRGHRGSQSALWLGRTTHSLTLEPGASRSLPLRVSACRPGVYDIANLRLESRLGDSDVPFLVSVPSIFITISDTRS
uniref:Trafficking protein particle complex subunit 8 n=1 Tax=Plectus sambesii TaxID=2011161 RepID=A0A914XF68_9BILA